MKQIVPNRRDPLVTPSLQNVTGEAHEKAVRLTGQIDQYLPLIRQVIDQAQRRVLRGTTVPAAKKEVSLFELHTRIIHEHKGGADVEFGRMVVVDDMEAEIVTRFVVLEDKRAESSWSTQNREERSVPRLHRSLA